MSDTKEHILNVSFGLFLQKSFKEVTLQEIVEKTGMSKGAFYHYFESKEQLFLEVVNYFTSFFDMDYSKFSKDSLYQFYHDYIKFHYDYTKYIADPSFLQKLIDEDQDSGISYFILMFDALKYFPSFRDKIAESLKAELKAWVEIIRIARENGEIKSCMTDEQIARVFIYTSDGAGMQHILKGMTNVPNAVLAVWDGFYRELKA